jgi:hypothetical protein
LTTVEGCKAEAVELGLKWDDGDQEFAGEWEVDGCYYYVSSYQDGYYNGRAYFGTGGSDEDKLSDFCVDDIHVRIGNCSYETS